MELLLTSVFNIEYIQGAKTGLVDYVSRQLSRKAKVTNKYDNEFAVPTYNFIHDQIAAINISSAPPNCQSYKINTVNKAHSTRATNNQQKNNSELLFCL